MSPRLPLCSSRQVIQALKRCGFSPGPRTSGGHQSFVKTLEGGRHAVTVVPLGKKTIPRGTLKNILALAGLDASTFLDYLR